MYSRIIAKLKDKIDVKIMEIEGEDSRAQGESEANRTVKDRLNQNVKELIRQIREVHKEKSEVRRGACVRGIACHLRHRLHF